MSLTRQVKNELARLEEPLTCCGSWELKALLLKNGYYNIRHNMHVLSMAVDDNAVARRLFCLLRQTGIKAPSIIKEQERRLDKTRFLVQIRGKDQIDALLVYLNISIAGRNNDWSGLNLVIPKRPCCCRAFLRGAFLAGGTISISRRSGYHLELSCANVDDARNYQKILERFNLKALLRHREDYINLYFKSAEFIADFLRIIGAGKALLELESMRVFRSMRNQVNRVVNCETANLEKVVASAQQQLDLIDLAENKIGLNNLPPSLREAALVRRKYPDASLTELGRSLNPPVSKSGMNHRFRQLNKMFDFKSKALDNSSKNHANT